MIDWPVSSLFSALVVEPDHVDRVLIHSSLASAGFTVATTNNYEEANAVLVTRPPLVLVTAIRLGAYNGLHLALRGRIERARMVLIVTSSVPDLVLQRDAEQIGATFILKPVAPPDLLAAVYRTALRRPNPDGEIEPIRPPFERRRHDRRTAQAVAVVEDRRRADRRRDLPGLLLRATSDV